jgi:nicotinamidase-related amidase
LDGHAPLEKTSFGCLGDAAFQDRLSETGRNQLVIAGVEAHVCVLQTALAALEQGYDVYVARDAVSSSSSYQREAAYERLWRAGAVLVTAQMAMFEMLGEAGTPRFKAVLRLLK